MRNCPSTRIFQFISNDSLAFSFLPFSSFVLFGHYTSTYTYINIYCILEQEEYIQEEARFHRLVVHFIYRVALICYHKKLARMPHGLHLHHGSRGTGGWVNLIIKVRVERRAKKNRRASLRFEQLSHTAGVFRLLSCFYLPSIVIFLRFAFFFTNPPCLRLFS